MSVISETQFSENVAALQPSATLAVSAKVRQLIAEGKDVLDLCVGEPDFPTPDFVREAGIQAIQNGKTRYTPAAGIPELRAAIAKDLERLSGNGRKFEGHGVVVTAGGKQALFNTIFSLFGPGDQVICPVPYWTTYPELVELARAKPLFVEGEESRSYKITPDDLERSYSSDVKGLIINSPSNPSGAVYSLDELRALAEWATERDVWIITDEIYRKIYFPERVAPSVFDLPEELTQKVVLVDGASKAFAMTGWRIGFTYSSRPLADKFAALQSQTTSNASSPAQYAALAAFQGGEQAEAEVEKMRQGFLRRRDLLTTLFRGKLPGVRYVHPEGAFYFFFSIESFTRPGEGSIAFCERILGESGVGLIPGIAFGQDDMARMSFAYSEDTLRSAIDRLSKAL
ncbi:MAG: pyridoxal phosphate-dependent aminotransferase [Gemmatimonadetes bacterium]|nr:pyridoxal phosphate-dependent aminotransferase [Gemmatimonadota bacterium]